MLRHIPRPRPRPAVDQGSRLAVLFALETGVHPPFWANSLDLEGKSAEAVRAAIIGIDCLEYDWRLNDVPSHVMFAEKWQDCQRRSYDVYPGI